MAMLSDYCRRIQELLLRYCDSLRVDSGGNLHDEAIAAENVFKEILNATYGWNLTNEYLLLTEPPVIASQSRRHCGSEPGRGAVQSRGPDSR